MKKNAVPSREIPRNNLPISNGVVGNQRFKTSKTKMKSIADNLSKGLQTPNSYVPKSQSKNVIDKENGKDNGSSVKNER